jgi:DNA-binding transcriptional LysR family regulator
MDLWKIRYFLVVAKEKSISSAAQKLHISQPPLSRHIKSLEKEIGVPLFIRKKSGLVLTETGRVLKERGEELIDLYEEIIFDLKKVSSKNNIIFGANDGGRDLVVPVYTELLNKRFDYAEVISRYGPTAEIMDGILNGTIDIGFIRVPFSSMGKFDIIELELESWVALMSENYPMPEDWKDGVTRKQLYGHPLIVPTRQSLYLPLIEALTVGDGPPDVLCHYFALEKAVIMAENDLGISIVPSSIKKIVQGHDYITKNIKDLKMTTCYAAIKKKGEFRSETLRRFWEVIQGK